METLQPTILCTRMYSTEHLQILFFFSLNSLLNKRAILDVVFLSIYYRMVSFLKNEKQMSLLYFKTNGKD